METIFDHGITDEEFDLLFGEYRTKEDIKAIKSQDEHYALIASLYAFRDDPAKMDEYIEKIKDPQLRTDTARTLWTDYHSHTRKALIEWKKQQGKAR